MWIIFSLLTAFSLATSDALTKRALSARNVYFVAWLRLIFALPLLAVCMLFVDIPPLDRTFWLAVSCALPLEIAAIILYTKALKSSPISTTMPFLALTPVFLIVTSWIILGERVSLTGSIGILLMAAGGYTLNFHTAQQTLFGPVRAVFREKGSVMMIIVAFIYSITSSLGKVAIEHSSPVFFGSIYFMLLAVLFTPVAFVKGRGRISLTKKDIVPFSLIGITYGGMIIFHMVAMSMTQVAYMIAVKRTSLLFSIFYGHVLFREKNIAEKTVGGCIMLAGFFLIVMNP